MYNFLKKAFHLNSEKNEDVKIEDNYLKSIIFQAEKNNASEKTLKTIRDIISAIAKKDKKTLREICSASGVPEEAPLLRSILWKINLKFLDLNVENWADIIAKKRSEYNNMKEAFIMKMEIDRKIHEDSSGNNTNNIIRKNGDSINETGEESKDSSSKSKSNSRNNLNCNNNNSKSNNNLNNNKDNLAGLNCNSFNNNSKFGCGDNNLKNCNEDENQNKNNLDKNANLNSNAINNNFSTEFSGSQTFAAISANHAADANQNNLNQDTNQIDNIETKENKKVALENFIAKNQTEFSRNFLNLEFDERKMKKNKKNIVVTNHNEIYKEFSRLEDHLLSNQVEIIKTYNFERNEVSHNKSLLNSEFSMVNITFDAQANCDSRNFNKENKPNPNVNFNVKREKEFDFLKKLNEEKSAKTTSNIGLYKVPLPNSKTNLNVNNFNYKNNFERRTFDSNLIHEGNENFESNNKQAYNEFAINSSNSNRNNYALTPQIKLNKNQREASNDNKNRNKIDFNFSVIDFLNKNVSNGASNSINKANEKANANNNKDLNNFISECGDKDKINSLKFLKVNNSNNTKFDKNPSEYCSGGNTASQKTYTCKIKAINLNTDLDKTNAYLNFNNNNTADNTNNKFKSKFTTNNYINNNNINEYNQNNTDLKNNAEEKKESINQKANLGKKLKKEVKQDKSTADPLLETLRKNAKMVNYEDKALIDEIYKDMKRTHSEFQFLIKPAKPKNEDLFTNFHLEKILTQKNKNGFTHKNNNPNYNQDALEEGFEPETHLDVIARLLYIFAKLNKNIRYVQGMNQLASLIYYVIMQEEELEKINFLMQQQTIKIEVELDKKKTNFNAHHNNENSRMQSNKIKLNVNKENAVANGVMNNSKPNKDKEKLGFKSNHNEKVSSAQGKNLDASGSVNATTKLCDLARLEEAEEEKNFFDLNADRKISNFQADSPIKERVYQNENLVNFLQRKNQDQNYLLGSSDKKTNHMHLINEKENPTINGLNNLHYLESVNNHEELFGLSSNRLVRNVNNNKNALIRSSNNNNWNYKYNNNINGEANYNNNINNLNGNGFDFNRQVIDNNQKQMGFGYLDNLNNKNNFFLTPDISKGKITSKLNLIHNNNSNKAVEFNNNNKLNNMNPKQINSNYTPSNYNFYNTNTHQNTPSAFTDRKLQNPLIAEKNANAQLNPKLNLHPNPSSKETKLNSPETDFEADTFWCFCYLMDQLKYIYLRSEDHKERGVMRKLDNLKNLLKISDKSLLSHLESVSVDISLFGFKWFVLLFSQNFCIKDALKIWDLILFVEHPTDIFYKVYYIALAVFECKRSKLIGMDFPGVVLQLQNLNDINIDGLIAVYRKIMKDSGKKIKKALGY